MLSLAKLAGADQRYYLEQADRRIDHTGSVATGAEDYYLSGPEAAGTWTGSAATALSLDGEVAESELRALLTFHDPCTGDSLPGSVSRARMPGYDLMFSVPKSASVLFGIGDAGTQRAVLAAQEEAVAAGMAYLEHRACRTRRGAGGYEIVEGQGFVGAAFRHRTSRAGDPQIHTHVLVANATKTSGGSWGTLDGRAVYAEARTAGYVHEAAFRRALSRRLGVEWTDARNGIAEIRGVPAEIIDAFSRRRAEIDAQVEAWGVDTASARQSAAVQTRKRKDYGVTPDRLAPEWRRRAAQLGFDHRGIRRLFQRVRSEAIHAPDRSGLATRLVSPDGLTARQSSFDRRDVVRAYAEAATQGATLSEIDAFADAFVVRADVVTLTDSSPSVRREDVIRRRDGRVVAARAESPKYSTVELLAVEQRVVEDALSQRNAGAGLAQASDVNRALAERPSIVDDQAAMVQRLCLEGHGVQVVVGPPGTGKTFALDASREAWQRSGMTVYGAAVARRAAMELSDQAGIEATSVAALLTDLRHGTADLLSPTTVLVVDEAGMLGTRPLAELLGHTRAAGAKLVLVGDPAQLPEIDAGGAFRALVNRLDPVVLERNRRQQRASDRELLELWRQGEVRQALTLAREQGDLILGTASERLVGQLVAEFSESIARGEDAIIVAQRRADVRRLNELAREALQRLGVVGETAIELPGGSFGVGDHVILRLNSRRFDVENGTRGRVVMADLSRGAISVALRDGRTVALPAAYLQARTRRGQSTVEHGYALTAHLAQGMTTDRAFVLASEDAYREWGYVALSRARLGTRFYVVEPEVPDEHHTGRPMEEEPFDEATRRLERSEAQHLAVEVAIDPAREALRRMISEAAAAARAAADRVTWLERQRSGLGKLNRDWSREINMARRAEAAALQRVGTASEELHELTAHGASGSRSAQGTQPLAEIADSVGSTPDAAVIHAVAAKSAQVVHLEDALGPRPESLRRRLRWDRAARRLERYRHVHGVSDLGDALGPEPGDAEGRRAWRKAQRDLARARFAIGRGRGSEGRSIER